MEGIRFTSKAPKRPFAEQNEFVEDDAVFESPRDKKKARVSKTVLASEERHFAKRLFRFVRRSDANITVEKTLNPHAKVKGRAPISAASSAVADTEDKGQLHREFVQESIAQFTEKLPKYANPDFFNAEFVSLKEVGKDKTAHEAQRPVNLLKNRYPDVLAYDDTRVRMQGQGRLECDALYINGNYIRGVHNGERYIATQGPLEGTASMFWRMVWSHSSNVIVMLTRCVEGGRSKCYQYWPEGPAGVMEAEADPIGKEKERKSKDGKSKDKKAAESKGTAQKYGDITVKLIHVEEKGNYVVRKFELKSGRVTRHVTHYQYTSWPDHSIPDALELLHFLQAIRPVQSGGALEGVATPTSRTAIPEPGPIVVHCSAGIGRTGTFIAADRLYDSVLSHVKGLNIKAIVADMRSSRAGMVQTQVQYAFLYKFLHTCLKQQLPGAKLPEEAQSTTLEAKRQVERE